MAVCSIKLVNLAPFSQVYGPGSPMIVFALALKLHSENRSKI